MQTAAAGWALQQVEEGQGVDEREEDQRAALNDVRSAFHFPPYSQGFLELSGGSLAALAHNGHSVTPARQRCCANEEKPDSSQAHMSSLNDGL